MKRPEILLLALSPMMMAATCPEQPAPVQDIDPSNDPTLDVRCGVLRIGGVDVTPEQLEQRIQGVIDALGLDLQGKTIIIEAAAFQGSDAIARATLDTTDLDDADTGTIVFNTNQLGVFATNPNFANLVLAHELAHLTRLLDANDPFRARLADLIAKKRAFEALSSRSIDDLERQRALVAALEADVAYHEAVIQEETRVYGGVENDRQALERAGLLVGDGRAAAATITNAGNLQTKVFLVLRLNDLRNVLNLERQRLEQIEAAQPPEPPSDDEQASLDRQFLHVTPVALAGDGGCGIGSTELSVLQGMITMTADDPSNELLVPLETAEVGLTDFAPILGELGVTCSVSLELASVGSPATICLGTEIDECDESAIVGLDAASIAPSCLDVTSATVASATLTCFTDDAFTEVRCEEQLGIDDSPPSEDPPGEDPPTEDPPGEDPPTEDPPGEDPPTETTVRCSPDRAELSGEVVPAAGVEIDPATSSCSAVSGFPEGDQLVIDDFGGSFGGSGSGLTVLDVQGGSFENLEGFFLLDQLSVSEPISIDFRADDGETFSVDLTIEPGRGDQPAQLLDVAVTF